MAKSCDLQLGDNQVTLNHLVKIFFISMILSWLSKYVATPNRFVSTAQTLGPDDRVAACS